jgi:SynChlorMet cassette radical SAM/SPASM protein ScmE
MITQYKLNNDLTLPPKGVSSSPISVDLELTGKCNLSCLYCFYANNMQKKHDLKTDDWLSIIKELGNLTARRVTLSGGEVFTRSDIFDIIDGIIDNRMRYSILSNGTLITKDLLKKFDQGKRRLRLDFVQISIDGSNADIHNLSRPPNSFSNAINGLRLLLKAKLPTTVRVTLNPNNINNIEEIAHLLLDDIGVPNFSTNEVEPMGSAKCHGESILLSKDQRKIAMKKLMKLKEDYGNRISGQSGPVALAQKIIDINNLREAGETKKMDVAP